MMLGGAVLLALSQATGELHSFPHISLRAGLALSYLIVAGSLLGFTAYVWLLARMPATQVASHAYVNPLVAVALGDRKSTRLNSSHLVISYAVFCLKKKKKEQTICCYASISCT